MEYEPSKILFFSLGRFKISLPIISIRKAFIADLKNVYLLIKELGLAVNMTEVQFSERWKKYCEDNLALPEGHDSDMSIGWVLLNNTNIVGFFGSIPRLYHFEHKNLRISVASTWAVKKEFREYTKLLSNAYFEQKDVDLLMVTTAIKPTSKIFSKYEGDQMPLSEYARVFFWILAPASFLNAAFLKKKLNKNMSMLLSYFLSPLFYLISTLKIKSFKPSSKNSNFRIEKKLINEIGSDFDDLWKRKIEECSQLLAYRNSEFLRWNLELSNELTPITLICCYEKNKLEGYIVLATENISNISLKRYKIIDLFTVKDDQNIIDALLTAAYKEAKELGCHVIELVGFTEKIRMHALKFRPFSRNYKSFPYYYKALSEELYPLLFKTESWYPSLYDGDGSF